VSNLPIGKYRRGTSYKFDLPTIPTLTAQPRRAEIHQKQYHHDILVLEFSQPADSWFEVVNTGVPVRFSWSQGPYSKTFYGYVSFLVRNAAGQIENTMEVHCVGTTFVLKSGVTKVYTNSTIPAAVKAIVTDYGFNFIGEDDTRVFEQLTVAGHSWWEWIQEQAKRIGYGVLVDGMNFYFRPLDALIDQNITSVPVLSLSTKETPINTQVLDRTLDSIKVLQGEHIEDSNNLRALKIASGVDPITGRFVRSEVSPASVGLNIRSSVNDVLFSEYRSEQVVQSNSSAISAAAGAATMARLNMPAKIKCQGDPRITPFHPVMVKGTGPQTDGYWVVKEVKHMFARIGDYQIEMTAGTDGIGNNLVTSNRQGTDTVVGMVNLDLAIANGVNMAASGKDLVKLKLSSASNNMTGQGFSRTPATWVYGG
jgi:phage protein D